MKLWVFGDSYSTNFNPDDPRMWFYEDSWITLVQKSLNIDIVENKAYAGVSNDYIFQKLAQSHHLFNDGDYVIIQLTHAGRKWFFKDDPSQSNIVSIDPSQYEKHIAEAISYYMRYLQNDNLDDIQFTAYTYAIENVVQSYPKVNFIVIPGFTEIPEVKGNLTGNVCTGEFKGMSGPKFYEDHGFIDPRLNHMSHDNHPILADKVLDYFKNGTPLDLTTNFVKNIYK
jgi:hypothetical protein